MKNQASNHHRLNSIPWNVVGQIILAVGFFYLLSWLVTSLSFAGRNGIDVHATQPVSSLEIFDNFGFRVFDTKWNDATWTEVGTRSDIHQLDGILVVSRKVQGFGGLTAHRRKWRLDQISYVESRLMLSSGLETQAGEVGVEISTAADGAPWFAKCEIQGKKGEITASVLCQTADGFSTLPLVVSYDTWHVVRFDVDAENTAITFFVDQQNVGHYVPPEKSGLKNAEFSLSLVGSSSSDGALSGSFDYVQLKNQ